MHSEDRTVSIVSSTALTSSNMTHTSTTRSSTGTAGTADTAGTAAALALMATDASTDKESVVDSEPLKPPPRKKKKIHTYNRRKVVHQALHIDHIAPTDRNMDCEYRRR